MALLTIAARIVESRSLASAVTGRGRVVPEGVSTEAVGKGGTRHVCWTKRPYHARTNNIEPQKGHKRAGRAFKTRTRWVCPILHTLALRIQQQRSGIYSLFMSGWKVVHVTSVVPLRRVVCVAEKLKVLPSKVGSEQWRRRSQSRSHVHHVLPRGLYHVPQPLPSRKLLLPSPLMSLCAQIPIVGPATIQQCQIATTVHARR